jgi:hypothetical protein
MPMRGTHSPSKNILAKLRSVIVDSGRRRKSDASMIYVDGYDTESDLSGSSFRSAPAQ